MKRLFACIVLFCLLCSCARIPAKLPEQTSNSTTETSAVYTPKPDEIRAVWISCYELPDAAQGEEKFRERAEEMFNNVADMKLNTVFVHVRAFADAVYPSKLFPWSKYSCKGSDPGFDPLKVMVECAHRAGLKIHAWINPFRVSSSDNIDSLPQGSPAKKLIGTDAVIQLKNGIYFDPASTDVHALIYDGVREILDGYEVDGIHIDDYFYPTRDESIDRAEYEAYVSGGGDKGSSRWTPLRARSS